MNDVIKTLGFVGGAALLWVLAGLTGPKEAELALFSDQGETFFPAFLDPTAATELEVWQFDAAESTPTPFAVKKDSRGVWTIPSHYEYPADAKTRMSKSASMVVGLKKDQVVSDRKQDHVEFGVVDPKDESTEAKGRGTLVIFKDGANTLAELVIGNEVDDKPGVHYVRVPGKNRVYSAKFDNQLSTKFADWIETDLLKAQSWDIQQVTFDNYTVDEQQQAIVKGDTIVAMKDEKSQWTLAGLAAEEEANADKLREVGDSLGQIKIVGVRKKPDGITASLKLATGLEGMFAQQSLLSKGYFLTRDGSVVSNEGDLLFTTSKGIRYTLRFGEIAYGEGDEVTSGAEPKPSDKPKDGEQGPQPKVGNNRFLMVTAEFDPALLKQPTGVRMVEDEFQKRMTAKTDLEAIVAAIDAYKQKNEGKLPATLAALTEKVGDTEPFLQELKKDPWDGDYVLEPSGETFVVMSYGADKQAGGEGLNADVRNDKFALEDEQRRTNDEWQQFDTKVDTGKKEAASLTKRFGPWYYVIDNALFQKLKPQRKDLVKPKEKTEEPAPGANGGAVDPGK